MKILYRALAVAATIWVAKAVTETIFKTAASRRHNEKIDAMSSESFPSSDAPSSWAGTA